MAVQQKGHISKMAYPAPQDDSITHRAIHLPMKRSSDVSLVQDGAGNAVAGVWLLGEFHAEHHRPDPLWVHDEQAQQKQAR